MYFKYNRNTFPYKSVGFLASFLAGRRQRPLLPQTAIGGLHYSLSISGAILRNTSKGGLRGDGGGRIAFLLPFVPP